MGMPSIPQLLVVLAIVALIFGTKKLKGIGGDLGGAIKGFKKALGDDSKAGETKEVEKTSDKQEEKADS